MSLLLILLFISCFKSSNSILCPLIEKQSLLTFKQSLQDPNHQLSSWDDKINCCKWKGVVCNNSTSHVDHLHLHNVSGLINPSLLNLKHLTHLDLSLNTFIQTIPSFLGSFRKLEYLNLSFSGFYGKIPHTIGNLSCLRILDLAGYPDLVSAGHVKYYHSIHLDGYPLMEYAEDVRNPNLLEVESLAWLSKLTKVEYVNLNFVNLSGAMDWLQVIKNLPFLTQLHLQNCSLDYISPLDDYVNMTSLSLIDLSSNNFHSFEVPNWPFQLNNLLHLDLRNNSFVGPIPINSNCTKLKSIDLSFNFLNSTIPNWLSSCKDLEYVVLDFNFLEGEIPRGFTNLCKTRMLSLSHNNLDGKLSDSFGNMSECFLEALQILDLQFNYLSGHLIDQLGEFKNLEYINLNKNYLSGTIPFTLGNLSSVKILSLGGNELSGNLPITLGQLFNLERLNFFDNKLEGVVSENLFANLTKLILLSGSHNHLTLRVGQNWIPPFQLVVLGLGSWDLGEDSSKIPSWIETQSQYISSYLDLSNTGISGRVPSWFWSVPILNLSHNHLHGNIQDLHGTSQFMYLSSNRFTGSLPRIGDGLRELDLSNNSFSGSVDQFLCGGEYQTYALEILHLGDNELSGELPNCMMRWPSLRYLSLSKNNMFGKIPPSLGFLANLQSLNLDSNRFLGQIPSSIQNCSKLIKIGLANNNLGGNIPTWIGTSLAQLRILILSSNTFNGEISSHICHLNSLQILDLSYNNLSGSIPRCVSNFTTMTMKRSLSDLFKLYGTSRSSYSYSFFNAGGFIESAFIVKKGGKHQYDSILPLVNSIDLSTNNLSGNIPLELTRLSELGSLNLSGNHLTGSIPERIGDMKQLESLDLSKNGLSGRIPDSLAVISSLGYLDLSYNNLSGKIPEGTQLQGFDSSSFVGNDLCGPPLMTKCGGGGGGVEESEGGDEEEIDWFYVCLYLGFAVGFSMVCTTLVLKKAWGDACFGFLESMWDKLRC